MAAATIAITVFSKFLLRPRTRSRRRPEFDALARNVGVLQRQAGDIPELWNVGVFSYSSCCLAASVALRRPSAAGLRKRAPRWNRNVHRLRRQGVNQSRQDH
jgi:hypothetical protein